MKLIACLIVLTVGLIGTAVVAQDNPEIEYGQTVEGEITDRDYEIPFDFTANQGDILILEMLPAEQYGELTSPDLIVLNADGDVVADARDQATYAAAVMVLEVPETDTYTVLATRVDGRGGDSLGEFTLRVFQPQELIAGEALPATISTTEGTAYFLVQSDGSPLLVTYDKKDGDYSPQISVNRVTDEWVLEAATTMSGKDLMTGTINVPAEEGFYIVTLAMALFDFYYEEAKAEYEIGLY